MPQGSPKKIQINLLLADLALQVGDPPLRTRQRVLARLAGSLRRHRRRALAWSAPPPQCRGPTRRTLSRHAYNSLPRSFRSRAISATLFPASQARYRRLLQPRRIFPVLRSRSSPRETVPYFRCLTSGVHYTLLVVFAVFCSEISVIEISLPQNLLPVGFRDRKNSKATTVTRLFSTVFVRRTTSERFQKLAGQSPSACQPDHMLEEAVKTKDLSSTIGRPKIQAAFGGGRRRARPSPLRPCRGRGGRSKFGSEFGGRTSTIVVHQLPSHGRGRDDTEALPPSRCHRFDGIRLLVATLKRETASPV